MDAGAGAYDEIAYSKYPFPQSHPDHLATIATLHGLDPPAPAGCRVLELGCGAGANLIPLAYGDPARRGVGVDYAAGAIADGQARIAALGLTNVELLRRDLRALEPGELGEFDFVIAHGVYTWVAPAVREALMIAVASHLAPEGIAYVSYDAQPGGYLRRMIRELGLWHARGAGSAVQQAAGARELYELLAEHCPDQGPYGMVLAAALPRLNRMDDSGLVHDDLAEDWDPVWFADFAAHAASHGLAYVGDAGPSELLADRLSPELDALVERLAGGERIARVNYEDILLGRNFRRSLLCHDTLAPRAELDPDRLRRLSFAAPPTQPGVNELMARRWPVAVAFDELAATAEAAPEALAATLLDEFRGARLRLHVDAPAYALRPGARPRASALARLQAAEGPEMTSLTHEIVRMEEPAARRLVQLLDGTRDRPAIIAALAAASDGVVLDEEILERNLMMMALVCLLHE